MHPQPPANHPLRTLKVSKLAIEIQAKAELGTAHLKLVILLITGEPALGIADFKLVKGLLNCG